MKSSLLDKSNGFSTKRSMKLGFMSPEPSKEVAGKISVMSNSDVPKSGILFDIYSALSYDIGKLESGKPLFVVDVLPPPDVEGDGRESDGLLSSAGSPAPGAELTVEGGKVEDPGAEPGGLCSEGLGVEDGARLPFDGPGSPADAA